MSNIFHYMPYTGCILYILQPIVFLIIILIGTYKIIKLDNITDKSSKSYWTKFGEKFNKIKEIKEKKKLTGSNRIMYIQLVISLCITTVSIIFYYVWQQYQISLFSKKKKLNIN